MLTQGLDTSLEERWTPITHLLVPVTLPTPQHPSLGSDQWNLLPFERLPTKLQALLPTGDSSFYFYSVSLSGWSPSWTVIRVPDSLATSLLWSALLCSVQRRGWLLQSPHPVVLTLQGWSSHHLRCAQNAQENLYPVNSNTRVQSKNREREHVPL